MWTIQTLLELINVIWIILNVKINKTKNLEQDLVNNLF